MPALSERAHARGDRMHVPPPPYTLSTPPRHVREAREGEAVATLVMGLYHNHCSECDGIDVNGGEELECTNCGAPFHFIRADARDRFLPEDYKAIEAIARATGLQISG